MPHSLNQICILFLDTICIGQTADDCRMSLDKLPNALIDMLVVMGLDESTDIISADTMVCFLIIIFNCRFVECLKYLLSTHLLIKMKVHIVCR